MLISFEQCTIKQIVVEIIQFNRNNFSSCPVLRNRQYEYWFERLKLHNLSEFDERDEKKVPVAHNNRAGNNEWC
ncbi:hypothetical protein T08_1396 [Trichinella sp. T8]|nr:hypothetical protein T08_1396 [Trichinella sp. T8]